VVTVEKPVINANSPEGQEASSNEVVAILSERERADRVPFLGDAREILDEAVPVTGNVGWSGLRGVFVAGKGEEYRDQQEDSGDTNWKASPNAGQEANVRVTCGRGPARPGQPGAMILPSMLFC
jgi:hypothetical protein